VAYVQVGQEEVKKSGISGVSAVKGLRYCHWVLWLWVMGNKCVRRV